MIFNKNIKAYQKAMHNIRKMTEDTGVSKPKICPNSFSSLLSLD